MFHKSTFFDLVELLLKICLCKNYPNKEHDHDLTVFTLAVEQPFLHDRNKREDLFSTVYQDIPQISCMFTQHVKFHTKLMSFSRNILEKGKRPLQRTIDLSMDISFPGMYKAWYRLCRALHIFRNLDKRSPSTVNSLSLKCQKSSSSSNLSRRVEYGSRYYRISRPIIVYACFFYQTHCKKNS